MSKVRGVRFNENEESLVEEFLKGNPFLDFTTLAKIAILKFIKAPSIDLNAVKDSNSIKSEKGTHANTQ